MDNRCETPRDVTPDTSRKRKKNSNSGLSESEKRQKRMVMNRVAAQNAREKKRQYVEDLERKLSQLETQNKLLAAENRLLKAEASRLALEKGQETRNDTNMTSMNAQDNSRSRGSAAPRVSQQKKQASRALYLQTWMAVSCLAWSLGKNGLKQHCLQATLPQMAHHVESGSSLTRHLILTLRASWTGTPPPPHLKDPP
eukprot:Em0015g1086a